MPNLTRKKRRSGGGGGKTKTLSPESLRKKILQDLDDAISKVQKSRTKLGRTSGPKSSYNVTNLVKNVEDTERDLRHARQRLRKLDDMK